MSSFIHKYYSVIFALFLAIIVGLSFYLGYEQGSNTSVIGNKQIVFSCPNTVLDKLRINNTPTNSVSANDTNNNTQSSANTQNGGAYLGSKNGTKYYTPGCPGAKRIKDSNIIWFQTVEDATLQGYSKGSC